MTLIAAAPVPGLTDADAGAELHYDTKKHKGFCDYMSILNQIKQKTFKSSAPLIFTLTQQEPWQFSLGAVREGTVVDEEAKARAQSDREIEKLSLICGGKEACNVRTTLSLASEKLRPELQELDVGAGLRLPGEVLFDVENYLEGILWNVQIYIDGYVPDYYYSP